MDLPLEITTKRLRLRMWDPVSSDPQDYARICADREVMRFLRSGDPLPYREAVRNVIDMRRHWDRHGFGWWAAVDSDTGELVGTAGLCHDNVGKPDFPGRVEIGVVLARPYWGHGLGTELASACCDVLLGSGVRTVYATADLKNAASVAVLRRAGFRFRGEIRNRGRDAVLFERTEGRTDEVSNKITPEMIVALNTLRAGARGAYRVSPEVRDAINTLDNADFFAPITAARDEIEGHMGLYDSPHSPGCPPIKHRH